MLPLVLDSFENQKSIVLGSQRLEKPNQGMQAAADGVLTGLKGAVAARLGMEGN